MATFASRISNIVFLLYFTPPVASFALIYTVDIYHCLSPSLDREEEKLPDRAARRDDDAPMYVQG